MAIHYNAQVGFGAQMTIQRVSSPLLALAAFTLAANISCAQDAQEYAKRLRCPATVKGFIGGESHDSYVVHARKGEVMAVEISWRHEHDTEMGNNHVEFSVSGMAVFSGDRAIEVAKESDHGKRWSARVPRTGNYYIAVMGHPTAHYVLKVTILPQ